jgi:L-asparaginase
VTLKNILIIGTGGTIAGIAPKPQEDPLNYAAGKVGINDLLKASLPTSLAQRVEVLTFQLANMKSGDLTDTLLSQLGQAVQSALVDEKVDGIVITHGTDTMEETGIFLHMTCSSLAAKMGKGVVSTGAMLPSNVEHADGPQNLSLAIELAAFLGSSLQPSIPLPGGVHGAFAGKVIFAKDYAKRSSNKIDAPVMDSTDLRSQMENIQRPIHSFDLSIPKPEEKWPWVEIITNHVGASPKVLNFLLEQRVNGIVFAGTGQGNIHENLVESILLAKSRQIPMMPLYENIAG